MPKNTQTIEIYPIGTSVYMINEHLEYEPLTHCECCERPMHSSRKSTRTYTMVGPVRVFEWGATQTVEDQAPDIVYDLSDTSFDHSEYFGVEHARVFTSKKAAAKALAALRRKADETRDQ